MPFRCFEFFQKDISKLTNLYIVTFVNTLAFYDDLHKVKTKKKGDNIIPLLMANHQNLFYLGKSITTTTCWEADKVGVYKIEGQIYQYYLSTY